MTLPARNLDDRRFQDLVNEAKRLVAEKCPEWTDHNVSDPGVTLIEAFATMTEMLLYRLNQVPDKNYVKFLELIGVKLAPPQAAKVDVTFWLSGAQPELVRIPAGTRVGTVRTETEPGVTFSTSTDLDIVPCALTSLSSVLADGTTHAHTEKVRYGEAIDCFSEVPQPGDALVIGLSAAVPSCALALRFTCNIAEGQGVDPKDPPIVWEAFDGERWVGCEVDRDETGGLNGSGDVIVHVPSSHVFGALGDEHAGWIRCRVVETRPDQAPYGASPEVTGLQALTIGGTARAQHADAVGPEIVGISEGVAGQRFELRAKPVVRTQTPVVVEVSGPDGWEEWTRVEHFMDSDKDDPHFSLEEMTGTLIFGPAVRDTSGDLTQYGAAPPAGAAIRVREYFTGGGIAGNVAARKIKVMKSSIPYVRRVENRRGAQGGTDAEDLENAKTRGPLALRGSRAVAARDYEYQAREAAKNSIARVKCLEANHEGADANGVRVLVIPSVSPDEMGRLRFSDLHPLEEQLGRSIQKHLDLKRCVGARVSVEPPLYMGIAIEASVRVGNRYDPKVVEGAALTALYRYFSPITGGKTGQGWGFGRPVNAGEIFWVLQGVEGITLVERAQLFPANPITGQRGDPVDRLELAENALVFSHEHVVEVEREGAP